MVYPLINYLNFVHPVSGCEIMLPEMCMKCGQFCSEMNHCSCIKSIKKEEKMSLPEELRALTDKAYDLEKQVQDLGWQAEFHDKYWELGKILMPGQFTNHSSEVVDAAKELMRDLISLRISTTAQSNSISTLDAQKHELIKEKKLLEEKIKAQDLYRVKLSQEKENLHGNYSSACSERDEAVAEADKWLKVADANLERAKAWEETSNDWYNKHSQVKLDVKNGGALHSHGISVALEGVKSELKYANKLLEVAGTLRDKWHKTADEVTSELEELKIAYRNSDNWGNKWYNRFWSLCDEEYLSLPGSPSYGDVFKKVKELKDNQGYHSPMPSTIIPLKAAVTKLSSLVDEVKGELGVTVDEDVLKKVKELKRFSTITITPSKTNLHLQEELITLKDKYVRLCDAIKAEVK